MPDIIVDHLALIMFAALTVVMFIGYPVAFVLGAAGIFFGFLGIMGGVFSHAQFANLLPRIYGRAVQNPVLVAVPLFIFMGTMLEKRALPRTCTPFRSCCGGSQAGLQSP